MSHKKEKVARFGIFTKGFVYCMIGGLALLAAFGQGGKKTGSSGVLDTLINQPFGQILLGATALGLLGFTFWRFYQTFVDPQEIGSDFNGIVTRIAYAFSAIFYSYLAFSAAKIIFVGSSESGGDGTESVIAILLSKPFGQILVGIIATVLLGKAIYQLHKAYFGKFKKNVQAAELNKKAERIVLNTGYVGYTARGIVVGVVSYLIFKAAFYSNSNSAGGTKEAFSFLETEFGSIMIAVTAIGLLAYGFFMIVKARYKTLEI